MLSKSLCISLHKRHNQPRSCRDLYNTSNNIFLRQGTIFPTGSRTFKIPKSLFDIFYFYLFFFAITYA